MTSIGYSVSSNWGSGFIGNMTVAGGSRRPARLDGRLRRRLRHHQHLERRIVSHVGNHYVISNADWNGNVAAGSQASFGFQATTGSGDTTATTSRSTARPSVNAAAARSADPLGRRRLGDRRQQRHARPRLHRHPVGGGDAAGHGGLRHRQRHGDGRHRLHGDQRHAHLRRRRDLEGRARAGDGRHDGREPTRP